MLARIDGGFGPLVHVFGPEAIVRGTRPEHHRLVGGESIVLGDGPVFFLVTDETLRFEAREYDADASGLISVAL